MNRYGQQAMEHWQTTMPQRVRDLPDPVQFFTQLGEELETAVEELSRTLAGQAPSGEGYLQRVQRLTTARFEAEGQVLREMLLTVR
ncbi:hypothetical protein OHA72_22405 [Dactylosporangium sp. NBC_01737]|uniref:hypothetical protein n=1 Tax=Dactylosporangium sp. NBC_01737 TaxID=2975959 RepID=UPI002E14CE56|nr:hypothetical protein OHA72_22405 [Dactylosporangium sp. NBC_01737]